MTALNIKIQLLLVENSSKETEAILSLLKGRKDVFDWQVVKNDPELSRHLKALNPDIALVDLCLPEEKAEHLIREVKEYVTGAPLIGWVDSRHEGLAEKPFAAELDDFLVKDKTNPELLMHMLRYAVRLHRSEETLRRSEERFRMMIEHSSDIITMIDASGMVMYGSPSLERVLGYKPEELIGKSIFDYVYPEDRLFVVEMFQKTLQNQVLNQRVEFRFRVSSGSWRYLEAIGSTVFDDKKGFIAIVNSRDVTDRVQLEQELLSMSLNDPLTGLLNRRGFTILSTQQIKVARRTKEKACLIFADVDRLKFINDAFGHTEGDQLLADIGKILKESYRDPDVVARIGGDEFAILAVGALEANAMTLVHRLEERLRQRNGAKDSKYLLSLSIGVVHVDPNIPSTIEDLLARADTMMYQQKKLKNKSRSSSEASPVS